MNKQAVNRLWCDIPSSHHWKTEDTKGMLSLCDGPMENTTALQLDFHEQMFFFSSCGEGLMDFTPVTHVDFWFYTDDADLFKKSTDCCLEFSCDHHFGGWGVWVARTVLKETDLQEGWNHLILPIDTTDMIPHCDLTAIQRFRFYAVGLEQDKIHTVKLANMRFVNKEGLEKPYETQAEQVGRLIDNIGEIHTYSSPALCLARREYDRLPEKAKILVTNGDKLLEAEETYVLLSDVVLSEELSLKPPIPEEDGVISLFENPDYIFENTRLHHRVEDMTVTVAQQGEATLTVVGQVAETAMENMALRMELYIDHVPMLGTWGQLELCLSDKKYRWEIADLALKSGWNRVYVTLDSAKAEERGGQNTGLTFSLNPLGDVVVGLSHIRLTPVKRLHLVEDFQTMSNWQSTAPLTLTDDGLQIMGEGEVLLWAEGYELPIVRPDRTPFTFAFSVDKPQNVTDVHLVLTDGFGLTATTKISDFPSSFMVVPCDMTTEQGFCWDEVNKMAFRFSLKEKTTLTLQKFSAHLREEPYWQDWYYDYQPASGDYSVVVIPDIQELTVKHPEKLNTMMNWIAQNKEKENIRFVIDVGDVTWNGHNGSRQEFGMAADAFGILERAGLNYSISYGNHDRLRGGDTTLLNEFFPLSKIRTFDSFGGVKDEGKIDNIYHTFSVDNINYMVLVLEENPTDATFAWANGVVTDHPHHKVMVSIHGYLGDRMGKRLPVGDRVWERLASKHENIFMVICGHDCLVHDPGSLNFREDKGEWGNTVYQVMANPQDIDAARGGVGLLLLLRFSDGGKTVDFHYFSPVHGGLAFKKQNQFSVTLSDQSIKNSKKIQFSN